MSRTLRRAIAVSTILLLAASACGNSGDDDDSSPTTQGGSDGAAPSGEEDRDTFVEISGVPGVTDDEISFAAIGTRTSNPLGTCILDCYIDGIKAYFAFRNSEGGIFGRDLVLERGPRRRARQQPGHVRSRWCRTTGSSASFNATLLASRLGRPRRRRHPHLHVGHPRRRGRQPSQHLPEHRDRVRRLHRAVGCVDRRRGGCDEGRVARLRHERELEGVHQQTTPRRSSSTATTSGERRSSTSTTSWRSAWPAASVRRSPP